MGENNMPINNSNSNAILRNKEKIRKFPWSAVTVGVMVGLSIQLIFNLLGLGIGAMAFDINSSNMATRSTTFVSWILISGIVAMFLGGWVAGSLSHHKNKLEYVMLGFATWSAATLITFFSTFSIAGALLNNTLSMTKQGLALIGQSTTALAQAAPHVADTAKNLFPDLTKLQDEIVQKAEQVFNKEKIKTITYPNILENLKKELKEIVISLVTAESEDAKNVAKEKAQSFLTDKLGFDRDQAEKLTNSWIGKYTQLKEQATDAAIKAKDKTAATTEEIVNTLGAATLITALAFIASGFAAIMGALVAGRRPFL